MITTFSATEVANMINVAVGSVLNWIKQGELKAGRTPGGHMRIRRDELLAFLNRQELPVPAELLPPTRTSVVVVDDEPAVAKWVGRTLKKAHPQWDILLAHDGFTAGELVGTARPALVILDLRMPGVDGFAVCRKIKSRPETAGIAVIAITAHHSAKAKDEILACGATDYLVKPLDGEALLAAVEAVIPAQSGAAGGG